MNKKTKRNLSIFLCVILLFFLFNYRNNMYKLIIRNQQQIRPLFYSFNEGINYCIQEYNKLPNCNI